MYFVVALGAIVVFATLFLLGDIETELSFSREDKNQDKNIEVSIERTMENGIDLTNLIIKGEGLSLEKS